MSTRPGRAHAQGEGAGRVAVKGAKRYGLTRGSVLYLDIEWYDRERATCNRAVLAFIDGFVEQVRRNGYVSGLYSSASAAIRSLDVARRNDPGRYDWPRQLWGACSKCRPVGDLTPYLSNRYWRDHQRLHQYALGVRETYGGSTYLIDKNYVDVGRGSVPQDPEGTCGVRLAFQEYAPIAEGDAGPLVVAAKCLLRNQGQWDGGLGERFGAALERTVRRVQDRRDLPVTGEVRQRTWVSLLATGPASVVKVGSTRQGVWRLQRALIAAGYGGAVTGVMGDGTVRRVLDWQRGVRVPRTGVVTPNQWELLRKGRVG